MNNLNEIKDMIKAKTFEKLVKHFGGNIEKAKVWCRSHHEYFDNITPLDLAMFGRHEELDSFVDGLLEEDAQ